MCTPTLDMGKFINYYIKYSNIIARMLKNSIDFDKKVLKITIVEI